MKLNILLPTLGTRENELIRLFKSLDNQTSNDFKLILISQGNHERIDTLLSTVSFNYEHIKINKIGLSYARNIGISYVDSDYLILSDDDAWYPNEAISDIILNIKNSNNDINCFKIYDPISKKFYKNYSKHKKIVTTRQMLKKSSIEICFNLNKIRKKEIYFNENFGLGTKYNSGEENLLLYNLMKKGYSIEFIDKTVVFHEIKEASEIDKRFIETKAMILKNILGKLKSYLFLNMILIKNFKKINKINKGVAFKLAFDSIFKAI